MCTCTVFVINCAVPEKNPCPPHGRSSENPRGRGVLIVKILKATYEAKLEFPRGTGGAKQKAFCGGVWTFSGTAQCVLDMYMYM